MMNNCKTAMWQSPKVIEIKTEDVHMCAVTTDIPVFAADWNLTVEPWMR